MAWFWFSVIVVLTLAYLGVYYPNAVLKGLGGLRTSHKSIGWLAVVRFAYIGFIFSNAMALVSRPERWMEL